MPEPTVARPRLTLLAWGFSAASIAVILLQVSLPLWLSKTGRSAAEGQLAIVWEACLVLAFGLAAVGSMRKEPKAKATFIVLASVLVLVVAIVVLVILSAGR
jgi:hypothetical protein